MSGNKRFQIQPGEVYLADRGYSHAPGIRHMLRSGGDVIVRLNWHSVPLTGVDGKPLEKPPELLEWLRGIPDATASEVTVKMVGDTDIDRHLRLIAVRKTEAAAEESRRKVKRRANKRGQQIEPHTLELAGYVLVLCSVGSDRLSAAQVLELYRFRWQIELIFKRLKSLIHLDDLPAKNPDLARTFIYAKLIAALMLEDFTVRYLDFSPWGYPIIDRAA